MAEELLDLFALLFRGPALCGFEKISRTARRDFLQALKDFPVYHLFDISFTHMDIFSKFHNLCKKFEEMPL